MIKTTCVFTAALFIFIGCGGNESGGNSTEGTNSNKILQSKSYGTTVISGLKTGTTSAVAQNNSKILNAALAGGNKNLMIPSGTWYTDDTILVYKNTTLSFEGKLKQIYPTTNTEFSTVKNVSVMTISGGDVILNNPQIDMGGMVRTPRINTHSGTHTTLAIYGKYNTGNITINGGILEGGSSNNFQGGRNNTVFNGTTFRDSREHLIYANGRLGDGRGVEDADGLIFNNCIFERPGKGNDKWESNHLQIRSYKNVEINNCIVRGTPQNGHGQYAILASGLQGFTVNDTTFTGYTAGVLWKGTAYSYEQQPSDHVFNNCTFDGNGRNWVVVNGNGSDEVVFNNSTINKPRRCYLKVRFNNCTIKPTTQAFMAKSGSDLTFDNCTWDYSNSTYSLAFKNDKGVSVNFTGTQTKIAPEDGHKFYWGPLANEG